MWPWEHHIASLSLGLLLYSTVGTLILKTVFTAMLWGLAMSIRDSSRAQKACKSLKVYYFIFYLPSFIPPAQVNLEMKTEVADVISDGAVLALEHFWVLHALCVLCTYKFLEIFFNPNKPVFIWVTLWLPQINPENWIAHGRSCFWKAGSTSAGVLVRGSFPIFSP